MADAVVTLALRTLRSNFRGELRFDESQQRKRYVIDPPTGKLVIPVLVATLEAMDTVLFIPEERDGAMEMLLTLAPLTQHTSDDALIDRWRIYHGEPEDLNWAVCAIDAARHEGFVIDGDALMQPNPLANDEPKLCKLLNEQGKDALAAITFHVADRTIDSPVAVGVDQFGVDVRARFEIVRLDFPEEQSTAEGTRAIIEQWTSEAGAA